MADSQVITLMRQFKASLLSGEKAQMQAMASRWLNVERRLSGNMELLAHEMAGIKADGGTVSSEMLMTNQRYRELLVQLNGELEGYSDYADRTITDRQRQLARLGIKHGEQAIKSSGIQAGFNRLPVEAVENLVGFAGDGTPLNYLLMSTWPDAAVGMTHELINGIALGYNPRKVAKNMAQGSTATLDRMMVIARTEQLRAYRSANLDSYRESGVVTSYKRLATHDSRVCAACLMDEGHVYTLDEEMPEHPQGRCTLVPVVDGMPEPQWKQGQEWFEEQDPATQKDILGKGRYYAWQNGDFALSDLVTVKPNAVWGDSLQVTPLRDLVGGAKAIVPPPLPYDLSDGTRIRNEFIQRVGPAEVEKNRNFARYQEVNTQLGFLLDAQKAERAAVNGGTIEQSDAVYAKYRPQIKALQDERELVWSAYSVARDELRGGLAQVAAVDSSDAMKIDYHFQNIIFGNDTGVQSKVKAAQEWLEPLVSNGGDTMKIEIRKDATGRASANPGRITINDSDSTTIIVHELTHNIEYTRGAAARAQRIAFFEKRTAGDTLEKFADAFPEQGYDDTEVFKRDKWPTPYSGKVYAFDTDTHGSSEVITMGVQHLHEDAIKFARDDPEYFDFIIGYLRGTL